MGFDKGGEEAAKITVSLPSVPQKEGIIAKSAGIDTFRYDVLESSLFASIVFDFHYRACTRLPPLDGHAILCGRNRQPLAATAGGCQ